MTRGIRCCLCITVVGVIALSGGCARFSVRTGKAIASVEGLERNRTTREEILSKFGPPQVVDETRGALYGSNHLAYEERRSNGWQAYIPLPLLVLEFPLIGFFATEEKANSTIFLFNDAGQLVDFATHQGVVGKRVGFTLLCWINSTMIQK